MNIFTLYKRATNKILNNLIILRHHN